MIFTYAQIVPVSFGYFTILPFYSFARCCFMTMLLLLFSQTCAPTACCKQIAFVLKAFSTLLLSVPHL